MENFNLNFSESPLEVGAGLRRAGGSLDSAPPDKQI